MIVLRAAAWGSGSFHMDQNVSSTACAAVVEANRAEARATAVKVLCALDEIMPSSSFYVAFSRGECVVGRTM